ncbi:MAG: hypothetical protein JSS22_11785 [Proteobacteria bacterium]|nr:hypothetical protein [Pseudomonadota bacterium]
MSLIAKILSHARPLHRVKDPTIEVLAIFCLLGLLLSLLAVRFGIDPDIGLSAIAVAQ